MYKIGYQHLFVDNYFFMVNVIIYCIVIYINTKNQKIIH